MRKRSINKGILMLCVIAILSLVSTSVVEAVLMSVKISGNLVAGGEVNSFELSPDGQYTVFIADAINYEIQDLFSVPSTGGTRILLSPGMTGLVMVKGFIISPDSQRVVYWVGPPSPPSEDNQITGIYSVAITGGSVINLSGILTGDKRLDDIAVSSNNQHVAFTILTFTPDDPLGITHYMELWSVPLLGGNTVLLESLPKGNIDFQITPNGAEIVFIRFPLGNLSTLWRTNMSGDNQEQLAGNEIQEFAITADGNRVIYTKQEIPPITELYSVSIEGGVSIKLNGELIAGGSVIDFKVSPDPDRDYVVYRADEVVNDQDEIFSVPAAGLGSRVRLLSGSDNPNFDVRSYQITPNGLGVVYKADVLADERFDLGSVSITGVPPHYWLNGSMVAGGQVMLYSISPDSSKVVFTADLNTLGVVELFVVTITGTNLTKLNTVLPPGGDVLGFQISHNSQFVVYYANQELSDINNLYLAGGGLPPIKLSNLSHKLDLIDYDITSDSKGVIYRADQDTYGKWELYSIFDRFPVYLPLLVR
ncbi:MAG: hypothetical protein Q7U53_03310 [Anaerolineaceae bacterium]|nr:hypothetical protein [Anaerolineaceae bacterium]